MAGYYGSPLSDYMMDRMAALAASREQLAMIDEGLMVFSDEQGCYVKLPLCNDEETLA